MLRLKLLDALMDMSRFLFAFRGRTESQYSKAHNKSWDVIKRLWNLTRNREALNSLWGILGSWCNFVMPPINDCWRSNAADLRFVTAPVLTYLLRWGHKVDGSVVVIIFLDETEGELVVDEEIVCLEDRTGKRGFKRRTNIHNVSCWL